MILEAALTLALHATPPNNCQRAVTIVFDSGNGAQYTGTICNGIKHRRGKHLIFYVDGENTITQGFLIFGSWEPNSDIRQSLLPGAVPGARYHR